MLGALNQPPYTNTSTKIFSIFLINICNVSRGTPSTCSPILGSDRGCREDEGGKGGGGVRTTGGCMAIVFNKVRHIQGLSYKSQLLLGWQETPAHKQHRHAWTNHAYKRVRIDRLPPVLRSVARRKRISFIDKSLGASGAFRTSLMITVALGALHMTYVGIDRSFCTGNGYIFG